MAATPEVGAKLAPVLVELLSRLPIELSLNQVASLDVTTVVTPPPSEPPPALARVFVDGRDRDVTVVYLVDAAWERVLVRRLPLERGLDEVAREQLAHVVESSVSTLIAGGTIGVSRAQASTELGVGPEVSSADSAARPPPLPPRPPPLAVPPPPAPPASSGPPPTERSLEARASAGWSLSPWTPQTLAQGPELRLRLDSVRGRLSWGGAVSGRYSLSRDVRSSVVGMKIEGVGLRVMAHARYALESSFAVLIAGGFGFDRETFRPISASSSSVVLDAGGARTAGILASSLGMEVRVAGPVWLGAEAGAELDLAPDDFVVRSPGGFVAIAEPLQLRPIFSTLVTLAP